MLDGQSLPSLSSIRAFEAAARLGGFAKAGAELGTTAAAVSYHVRQLERHTGLVLFERRAQSVTLTQVGSEIASETSRFFGSLRATFVRAAHAQNQSIALSVLPTLGASWLIPRLGRFRSEHPEIQVKVDLSEEARELGNGRYDAGIRHGSGQWPGLRAVRLFPVLFMPLCSPALRERASASLEPRSSERTPLIGRRDWWKQWLQAAGLAPGDFSERFADAYPAEHLDAAAAIAGDGITIGSPILFADEIAAGRLVPAHHAIATDGCWFWFAYPITLAQARKINILAEWLREQARMTICDVRERIGELPPSVT